MLDVNDRRTRTGGQEIRTYTIDDLEMRDGGGAITFDGVASVVGVGYAVRDKFGEFEEEINKGAFHRTIAQRSDVRLLKNHDASNVFARTKSGTMTLSDDPHLRAHAPSLDPSNPAVQILRSELKRGDIDQMSIGMRVLDDEWNADMTHRTIKEISLAEVSIVAFPASPTTSATVRSLDTFMTEILANDVDPDELRRAIDSLTRSLKSPAPSAAEELMRQHLMRRN